MIREPSPFDSKWFSHKFRGPGLRFEVGVYIAGEDIVRVYGPFPCGKYADLTIFKMGLKRLPSNGERVLADWGYQDDMVMGRDSFPACRKRFMQDAELAMRRLIVALSTFAP